MVYPGHASQGCTTCKLRKIGCDLGRPACRHCTRSGRVCLGYGERLRTTICDTIAFGGGDGRAVSSYSPESPASYCVPRHIEASTAAASLLDHLFSFDDPTVPSVQGCSTSNVAVSAMNTIGRCIYSLRQPEQSRRDRAALFAEYGRTTSELRAALMNSSSSLSSSSHTQDLACAAFLFSIYEMIVNIDPEDKTWRIHLDGLLRIFSEQAIDPRDLSTGEFDTFHHAVLLCNTEGDEFHHLAGYEVSSCVKASQILDVASLRLRRSIEEVENLFQTEMESPRKLDVQKLRASIKNIQKNLKLFPKICPKAELDITRVSRDEILINTLLLIRWNDYHCLRLIIADLLSSTERFIHPDNANYEHTREYSTYSSIMYETGQSICSTLPTILSTVPMPMQPQSINKYTTHTSSNAPSTPIMSLSALWPLCCVLKSPKLTKSQQSWILGTLWDIGSNTCIPRASALANSKAENTSWMDVIAGLLLVRVALSRQMGRAFGQLGVISF